MTAVSLRAGRASATLDPGAGGRIASLTIDDLDVLLTAGAGTLAWGCYPMVPWAGRLKDGRFEWRGRSVEVERTMPPNAIHGTALYGPWQVAEASERSATLAVELAPRWPLGGRAVHRVDIEPDALHASLEVLAEAPMPAIVGWHPWFPRHLARGGELALELRAGGMLLRGEDGLPGGDVVAPPPPGPWDDAFVDLAGPPRIRWPGAIELEVVAPGAAAWVVYTEEPHAIAVEPQTGPPNGLRTGEFAVVEPGRPLRAEMTIRWRLAGR